MAFNRRQNGPSVPAWAPLALLLAISVGCVAVYAREGATGPLHAIQDAAETVASPFAFAGAGVGAGLDNVGDTAADATASEETLTALREQNAELRELVAQAEEYRQEAERLEALLGVVDEYDIDGVTARVIGRSADAWNQSITVSAGSDAGVDAGMTVMGPSGVVGQVVSTTSSTATVRLLTDPQSGAAAMLQSSRAEGIVRGSLEGALYLEGIESDVTVQVGDVVVTSGLGGSYVRGLIVGTVVSVEGGSQSSSRTIVVAPNEGVDPLEEVVIVKSMGKAASNSTNGSNSSNNSTGANGANQATGGTQ